MFKLVVTLVFLSTFSMVQALADSGGGEGGGGPMAGGAPAADPAVPAPAPAPAAGPRGGTSTLPGGSTVTLSGPPGNRDVSVETPDGKTYKGKHIRTSRNSRTGITTVWIRNADGTRTGVHTDRQGNQSVSNHKT